MDTTPALLERLAARDTLTLTEQDAAALLLRDQYFALRDGALSEAEERTFRCALEHANTRDPIELGGLTVSAHPSRTARVLRFLDAAALPAAWRARCATARGLDDMRAVFLDPEELHLRTYEHIVPLDRLFDEDMSIFLDVHEHEDWTIRGALDMSGKVRRALLRLDELGLYLTPLNAGARGGERYIFHSAHLASALTSALREDLPAAMLEGFSHVNPVFRCNAFTPDDAPFAPHLDTPYYDAANGHISTYTLLIYLTGGTSSADAPTLRVEGRAITTLDAMSCVIFPQDMRHEGAPYQDGRKVFLRTELVYKTDDAHALEHDPRIAALFSSACYLTGESLVFPELEQYAADQYDRVAAAHWAGLSEDEKKREAPFLHRHFHGAHFVTNGHDYWFSSNARTLQECATLAILDHFNCRLATGRTARGVYGAHRTSFRSLCQSAVIKGKPDSSWIPAFLHAYDPQTRQPFPEVRASHDRIFPAYEPVDRSVCCPFHCRGGWSHHDEEDEDEVVFDAAVCADVHEASDELREAVLPMLESAPILLLGQEVLLNEDRFVIEPGRITLLSSQRLEPLNFAACWNNETSPIDHVTIAHYVDALHPLLPPLLYTHERGCYHLTLDLFQNSWVRISPREVPIPTPCHGGWASAEWQGMDVELEVEEEDALELDVW